MAQLKWEGISKIKIALAGTDTSSLTRLLEGCFGSVEPSPPPPASTEVTDPPEEHPTEEVSRSDLNSPVTESSLTTVELVFPMKSTNFFTKSGSLLPHLLQSFKHSLSLHIL